MHIRRSIVSTNAGCRRAKVLGQPASPSDGSPRDHPSRPCQPCATPPASLWSMPETRLVWSLQIRCQSINLKNINFNIYTPFTINIRLWEVFVFGASELSSLFDSM
jgi:hypothetical protein